MENNRYPYINRGEKSQFKVIIDEGEMYQIEKWVLKRDNIETGGDLFGLWIDEHTAVVQFVLGPGEGCRRTTASFYQDVDYLEKAGKYVTKYHGLCNIGQWHSHHRLGLCRPSGGDENTVWGNMPNLGLSRYIVFIATIEDDGGSSKANVSCFLFKTSAKGRKCPVLKGHFEILQGQNSPFRLSELILNEIKNGGEILHDAKTYSAETKGEDTKKNQKRNQQKALIKTTKEIPKQEKFWVENGGRRALVKKNQPVEITIKCC